MSPEQATGDMVDERSDIFSTGVVGYELLGGQRPFQGDSYSTVLRSILTVEPPPLEQMNPLVPDEVVALVHKMLQKDMSKRYQSIWIVRGDLETVIEQLGLHRGKDLLREYVQEPERVREVFHKKHLSRHLDQGLYFENMGLGKIDDAAREFQRVLFLDPRNDVAREHLAKLENERKRLTAEAQGQPVPAAPAAGPDDKTIVLEPGAAPPLPAAKPAPRPPERPAAPPPVKAPPPAAGRPAQAPPTKGPPPAKGPPRPAPAPVPARRAATPRDRVRLLLGSAAVLLTLLVGVGVVALMRGNREAERPQGAAPGPSSGTAQVPAAGAGDSVAAPSPTEAPGTIQPGNPPQPPSDETQRVALAKVTVISVPSTALVVLDRVARPQRTPASFPDLAVGPHVVRVEKSGYVAQEQKVKLLEGEERRLNFALAREAPPVTTGTGTVAVKARPYATYYLDGVLKASNFPGATFPAKSGPHTVKAVHPLGTKEWKVVVLPGKTVNLDYDFIATATGNIAVTSGGTWAKVFMDGKDTGKTTPALLEGLLQGDHTIELRRDGFAAEGGPQVVRVRPAQTAEAKFTLKQAN
jgi:hypothetical protein